MDDYIRLEDAINAIRENGIYGSGYSDSEREEDVIDMLTSLPRYQAEVKTDEMNAALGYGGKLVLKEGGTDV